MKALLWKDCRINRLVLIIALMSFAGPLLIGTALNVYALARYGVVARPWPNLVVITSIVSLGLSLLTVGMLGGNAVAGERMDRSAEFLAYLPPSRGKVITSKAILALSVGVFIWLVHPVLIYYVAPLLGEVPEDVIRYRDNALPVIASTSVILFGTAWLASTFLDSPAIATGIGFGAPWVLFAILSIIKFPLGYEDFAIGFWYHTIAVTLGILCFITGIIYYTHRVEP